ncbi:hypothetical protein OHA21_13355 [Actinoplanes sp. NBC_00393]|uniref:hypothetical protein n=1 Tax=Actinoplanes sp. NBC_00393 TaxID=2975953 RepID=UPI002E1E5EE6
MRIAVKVLLAWFAFVSLVAGSWQLLATVVAVALWAVRLPAEPVSPTSREHVAEVAR